MRKSYWKECCLLLLGLILGSFYQQKCSGSLSTRETTVIMTDTIKDTLYVKNIIPPLCKESVLKELIRQEIPHINIVLAQSMLETGNYTSRLSKTHHNIFGLRKGNKYRRYNNYIECIADYKRLISSKYKGGDYYAFLTRLGYAEDPNYVNVLRGIVRKI